MRPDAQSKSRLRLEARIAGLSALMLFYEVALIRWLSSEVRILAYFHNLVLLFCLFGMGLGLAMSRRRRVASWLPIGAVWLLALWLAAEPSLPWLPLRRISEYLSLGPDVLIWFKGEGTGAWVDRLRMAGGIIMLLVCMGVVTAGMVSFGRSLGALLAEHRHPLRAYLANLVGSLLGVWLFALASWWSWSPMLWFGVAGVGCLLWMPRRDRLAALCLLGALAAMLIEMPQTSWTRWSPYQKLTVSPSRTVVDGRSIQYGYRIAVNNVGYMSMVNYTPAFIRRHPEWFPSEEIPYDHYNVAYRFMPPGARVLVLGAGAGNDVAGALRNGAGQVTAVEIDPVILDFGRRLHPEAPYADPRVRIVTDDARAFLRRTQERYDLIVFGLLDAHTLSSGHSTVRLDHYVYTLESLRDLRRALAPGGVCVLLFEVIDDAIGARFSQALARTFGHTPAGFLVRSGLRGWGGYAFVVGDQPAIRRTIEQHPPLRRLIDEHRELAARWSAMPVELTTDDWPYLYLRRRQVPMLHWLLSLVLALGAYLAMRRMAGRRVRMRWEFACLGAGFMLLEICQINQAALLVGSTWVVNVLAISGVLLASVVATLLTARGIRWPLPVLYAVLAGLLLTGYWLPVDRFLLLPLPAAAAAFAGWSALPFLFSGLIFSRAFSATRDPAGALAANLLGAVVGGLLGSLALLTGLRALGLVVLGCYLAAWFVTERSAA